MTGADFKQQLRQGAPKMGLFLNTHSPTVAEQLAHSGYDWLLIDTQHGPMDREKLSAMICAIAQRRREIDGAGRRLRRSLRYPAGA